MRARACVCVGVCVGVVRDARAGMCVISVGMFACLRVNMNTQMRVGGLRGRVYCGAKPRIQPDEGNQSGRKEEREEMEGWRDGGREAFWSSQNRPESSGNAESFLRLPAD